MIEKPGGARNFGYGRSMEYAVGMILQDRLGTGRFSTRATYRSRLRDFLKFLKGLGIADLSNVTRSEVVAYADSLKGRVANESCSISTAVYRLSAVNVLMSFARHDNELTLSPAKSIGRRSFIRVSAPIGLGITSFSQLQSEWVRQLTHGDAIIATLGLARFSGARFREASLMPLDKALLEGEKKGSMGVTHGCKGGRKDYRSIPGSDELLDVLEFGLSNLNRNFVIPSHWNYVKWKGYAYRHMPQIASDLGIAQGFHDLRASFACARYRELTGVHAPVVAGFRMAPKEIDVAARQLISRELGHSRDQICTAYIGSAR